MNVMQAWNRKPYCSPIPGRRLKCEYESHPCNFCGSVVVLGGDALRQSKLYKRVFCDMECANEYKKIHNRTGEYREKYAESPRGVEIRESIARREVERQEAEKNKWTCCIGCFVAFKPAIKARLCGRCSMVRNKINGRAKYQAAIKLLPTATKTCYHCGDEFEYRISNKRKRFCSDGCERRNTKRNREHRMRLLAERGQYESISMAALVRKYESQCAMCGIDCTMPDGTSQQTEATIDHIMPLSKGGSHTWDNVQLLCRRCNCSVKGDTIPRMGGS